MRGAGPMTAVGAALALACATASCRTAGGGVPLVQPGAPGEASRTIAVRESVGRLARGTHAGGRTVHAGDDRSSCASARDDRPAAVTNRREDMRLLARRIELSQADEIAHDAALAGAARGSRCPTEHAHHALGAATDAGYAVHRRRWAAWRLQPGAEFDRLFLELMIKHHDGALMMVEDLFANPGAGQEPESSPSRPTSTPISASRSIA